MTKKTEQEEQASNIWKKIIAVMREVGTVDKTINAPQGYKAHGIDHIAESLREAMLRHGLVYYVDVKDMRTSLTTESTFTKDGVQKGERTLSEALMIGKLVIVNADNPSEKMEMGISGQGLDYSDKATGKAISYGVKPALLFLFQLRGHAESEESDIRRQSGKGPWDCPKCGEQSLMRAKGGKGYKCWASKGGCETSFDDEMALQAAVAERKLAEQEGFYTEKQKKLIAKHMQDARTQRIMIPDHDGISAYAMLMKMSRIAEEGKGNAEQADRFFEWLEKELKAPPVADAGVTADEIPGFAGTAK